jgi:hypothetical protein
MEIANCKPEMKHPFQKISFSSKVPSLTKVFKVGNEEFASPMIAMKNRSSHALFNKDFQSWNYWKLDLQIAEKNISSHVTLTTVFKVGNGEFVSLVKNGSSHVFSHRQHPSTSNGTTHQFNEHLITYKRLHGTT